MSSHMTDLVSRTDRWRLTWQILCNPHA